MEYQVIFEKASGSLQGSLPTVIQGSTLETITVLALYRDGSNVNLTGKTISGTATDNDGNTYALSGTFVGANGSFTWELSAGDVGTANTYAIVITYTDSVDEWSSDPVRFIVRPNPSATAVQNNALVGISTALSAWLAASEAGGALGTAAYEDATAFDAAGAAAAAQAAAIAALGGADGTVTDEQLRNWAGQVPELMTSVTRTDYSATKTDYDGEPQHAGSIHVSGTVTWPDGVTGHIDGIEYPEAPGVLQYFTASHVASGKIAISSPLVNGVAGVTIVTPDYYIDSAFGNGGTGTVASPYNQISDLPALQSGDIIALKSGGEWREQLTTTVAISIYRYGSGAKPILNASKIIVGTWTNDGTYTNLWYIDVTPTDPNVTDAMTMLFINGSFPTSYQATAALANANDDSFYVSTHTGATQRIYYNPTASNPNSDGRTYEYNDRSTGIEGFGIANCVFDGIVTKRNRHGGGSIRIGRSTVLRHVECIQGTKHNIYFEDGTAAWGCKFYDAMITTGTSTLTVYNENTPAGLGVSIRDSFYDSGRATYTAYNGGHGHYNTSGAFGAILYDRCYFKRLAGGVTAGSGSFTGITLKRCVQYQCSLIASLTDATGNTGPIRIEDNMEVYQSDGFFLCALTMTIYLSGNKIYGFRGVNGCIRMGGAGTWYVFDNEMENDGSVASLGQRIAFRYESGATATIREWNNMLFGSKDGSNGGATPKWGYYHYSVANPTPRILMDRNHYGDRDQWVYFPQNSINGAINTLFVGVAVTNVSSIAGTAGDASQEGQGLLFA